MACTDSTLPFNWTTIQVSSIEEEIDRLNESFLHLSLQLQKRGQMHTQRWESQHTSTDHAAVSVCLRAQACVSVHVCSQFYSELY